MRSIRKIFAVMLIALTALSCVACSGLDTLSDNLKGAVDRLGDDVAIGKSNALITPYQSFDGSRTSDNAAFLATYDAAVSGFNGQDILVADTDLKEKDCREITINYDFTSTSGTCRLIHYEYEVDNQLYTGIIVEGIAPQNVGNSFQIKYNPEAPEEHTRTLEPSKSYLVSGSVFAALGLAMAIITVVLVRKGRKLVQN